jgi:hypothetical protein
MRLAVATAQVLCDAFGTKGGAAVKALLRPVKGAPVVGDDKVPV